MGDISELRTLVTVVSFLGILVLTISLIPSQFYVADSMREVLIPDQWESYMLEEYADYYVWNLTYVVGSTYVDIGHRSLELYEDSIHGTITIWHRFGFLLLGQAEFDWFRKGIKVAINT